MMTPSLACSALAENQSEFQSCQKGCDVSLRPLLRTTDNGLDRFREVKLKQL